MNSPLIPGFLSATLFSVICITPAFAQDEKANPKDESMPIAAASQVAEAEGMMRALIIEVRTTTAPGQRPLC